MGINKTAERIEKAAQKLGYDVRSRNAMNTRSIYLTLNKNDIDVIVRVSDHMECYPPKRGERKLCVSSDEMTATQAINMLKAGPESIEPSEGPAPLTADQIAELKAQAEYRRIGKQRWQALRAKLTEEDFGEFRKLGANRKAARHVAERLELGVSVVYSALTNGKSFQRQSR